MALNRAIAIAEIDGPAVALAIDDRLDLEAHHLFHATRADLLERLGRTHEALVAYDASAGARARSHAPTTAPSTTCCGAVVPRSRVPDR